MRILLFLLLLPVVSASIAISPSELMIEEEGYFYVVNGEEKEILVQLASDHVFLPSVLTLPPLESVRVEVEKKSSGKGKILIKEEGGKETLVLPVKVPQKNFPWASVLITNGVGAGAVFLWKRKHFSS